MTKASRTRIMRRFNVPYCDSCMMPFQPGDAMNRTEPGNVICVNCTRELQGADVAAELQEFNNKVLRELPEETKKMLMRSAPHLKGKLWPTI